MKITIEHQDGTLATVETNCVKLTGDNLTLSVIERVLKRESRKSTYVGSLFPHNTEHPICQKCGAKMDCFDDPQICERCSCI